MNSRKRACGTSKIYGKRVFRRPRSKGRNGPSANWIVGPVYLLSFGILYMFRIAREERLMLDRFGPEYEAYTRRSGRLFPQRNQR